MIGFCFHAYEGTDLMGWYEFAQMAGIDYLLATRPINAPELPKPKFTATFRTQEIVRAPQTPLPAAVVFVTDKEAWALPELSTLEDINEPIQWAISAPDDGWNPGPIPKGIRVLTSGDQLKDAKALYRRMKKILPPEPQLQVVAGVEEEA